MAGSELTPPIAPGHLLLRQGEAPASVVVVVDPSSAAAALAANANANGVHGSGAGSVATVSDLKEDELPQPQVPPQEAAAAVAAPAVAAPDNVAFLQDCRLAVIGNVDAGKSSLIGTLISGILDDGRGLSRSRVFQHGQEKRSGRTSSISQHLLGFDAERRVVTQPTFNLNTAAQKSRAWRAVLDRSQTVMTFIDLAGHRRYLKTTVSGLAGCFPDFALVLVNGLQGVKGMTSQHISICQALRIPLICVVTKVDICPRNVLAQTHKQLFKILKSAKIGKTPVQVKNPGDVEACIQNMNKPSPKVVPVFYVSSVRATGLGLLQDFLAGLRPRNAWKQAMLKPTRFVADGIFNQVSGVGTVLAGTVSQGVLAESQENLVIGPFGQDGHFLPVTIRSLQCKRMPVPNCPAGASCSISFRLPLKKAEADVAMRQLRKGTVVCAREDLPEVSHFFDAEVIIFHHPSTISTGYQAMVHMGIARQAAMILKIDRECLRSGDRAMVRLGFLQRPEIITPGQVFVFREGNTKGIGRVTRALHGYRGVGHQLAATGPLGGGGGVGQPQHQQQAKPKASGFGGASVSHQTHWVIKTALKRLRRSKENQQDGGGGGGAGQDGGGGDGGGRSLRDEELDPPFEEPKPVASRGAGGTASADGGEEEEEDEDDQNRPLMVGADFEDHER